MLPCLVHVGAHIDYCAIVDSIINVVAEYPMVQDCRNCGLVIVVDLCNGNGFTHTFRVLCPMQQLHAPPSLDAGLTWGHNEHV
jgi:hypothetical protein